MSASVFDHPWLNGLFNAPDIVPLWSAEAQAAHMILYERAWTDALFDAGRIDATAADAARDAIARWMPDAAALREGVARDGLVIPTFIAQLRDGLNHPKAIHDGSTSQDVIDTALVLTLRAVTDVLWAEPECRPRCRSMQSTAWANGKALWPTYTLTRKA